MVFFFSYGQTTVGRIVYFYRRIDQVDTNSCHYEETKAYHQWK